MKTSDHVKDIGIKFDNLTYITYLDSIQMIQKKHVLSSEEQFLSYTASETSTACHIDQCNAVLSVFNKQALQNSTARIVIRTRKRA